nr:GNAT family N-acetyltransferase [Spelaeicoccus albus]
MSLTKLTPDDVLELHDIYSDPGTWRHLPSGRHTDIAATRALVERSMTSQERYGLGQWAARLSTDVSDALPAGTLVGAGGVTMLDIEVWNLGYRLHPAAWGRGFATTLARAGLDAAHDKFPSIPVTARALSNNPASSAILDKLGLTLVWRGASEVTPDAAPTAGLERVIYADRAISESLLAEVIALG